MLHPRETKGGFRYVQRPLFLKLLLCVLIALLVVKTAIDLSSSDDNTADFRQIDALSAEVYQQLLKASNLELVEGPLHEPSDPDRVCQATSLNPIGFSGSATLVLPKDTKVKLTISDCHPCAWPVNPDQDISAYASFGVEINDESSFTIESYVGGFGKNTSGTFRMLLPRHEGQRRQILHIIKQIAENAGPPSRAEFNVVLQHLLSSTHASISESDVLRFGTLLCKCIDISLSND